MLKNRAFGSIVVGCVLLPAAFVCCRRQEVAWRGTVQEEDGVTVVKNPKEPIYGEEACRVEEDLSLGRGEAGDEYLFSAVRDLAVDEDENIYVLDFKEPFVGVFDQSGKRVRTIGKRGQGPGEMQGPTSLCVTPRGELLVNDRGNRFLHFYTLAGEPKRSISLARWPFFSRPEVDAQDNIVARSAVTTPGATWTFVLKKFDPELRELFDIFSYQFDITPNVWDVLPPDCFWKVGIRDSVVWGYADKYEFQAFDGDGKAVRKVAKDYTPVETTEDERKGWIQFAFGDKGIPPDATVNWPKFHNAFQYLSVDEKDRTFVQTYEKTADGKGYFCDVFDPEGRFIVKIALRGAPRVVKKNRVYTIEDDELGYQVAKRYKLTWKF
jgi:hypothetical protein